MSFKRLSGHRKVEPDLQSWSLSLVRVYADQPPWGAHSSLSPSCLQNKGLSSVMPHGIPENSYRQLHSDALTRRENYSFFFFFNLFLAVLRLRFCARAFSSCGEWGPLFIAVHGPLTIAASLAAEHRLQTRRLSSCGSRA